MSLAIMQELNMGGSEFAGTPVGPGAGRELMLLYVGRVLVMGVGLNLLLPMLMG